MSIPINEKLIQRQINNWNRFRRFLHEDTTIPATKPVITVSRQAGSGGRALATAICRQFGLELQDRSLVERIVQDAELDRSLVADLDETAVNEVELWVKGVLSQRIYLKDEYHKALVRIVSTLAARGGVVFLGRGAELILGEKATLRVRVVASQTTRLRNTVAETGLSKAEARAVLAETDRKRDAFIRTVFRRDPGAPADYDLVLNADRVSQDCMLELVGLALLERGTGGRSRMLARG